ncbi:MAG: thiamine diphosphokinase [Acidimicrobiia bacterium]
MHVIVVSGGPPSPWPIGSPLASSADLVIAADSGYDHALGAGLTVDVLIGDLDSISAHGRDHAEANGVEIIRHRPDKDATDLTLALDLAVDRGASSITLLASGGGRLDHLLAGVLSLAEVPVPLRAVLGDSIVVPINPGPGAELSGRAGSTLTLLPVGGPAHGVVTSGLRYRLDGETLHAGSTRGVSNEFIDVHATVCLESGSLLAIAPAIIPSGDLS